MALSTRLRTARNSASAWPRTQTGPSAPVREIVLDMSTASGAMKPTASAQTAWRSALASPTTKLSSSAMSSTWLTVRVMLTRSVRSASRTGPGSSESTLARMMASGVRNSWAMSAVKSRCARKPASRRSNAWLTA